MRIRSDPLIGAVGRLPVTLSTKLLVAFAGTALLLVIVGVLGLRVIADSNDRVVTLGSVQQRASAYRELQTDAAQLRALLALRVSGPGEVKFSGGSAPTPESLVVLDGALETTLARPGRATDLAQPLGDVPADERSALARIDDDYAGLSAAVASISELDGAGATAATAATVEPLREAERIANDLVQVTASLARASQELTDRLILENAGSFEASQRLFVGVAAGSIVLWLLLGTVLSWSLIRPIKRMEARLDAIAAGDFSGHVDIPNRDELGALAANINRMNDELGRVYDELETASRHKSEFLANMSHELRTPLNAVIGFSQVLKQQMFGELNAKQAEYVDDILGSGQHLLNLINDILDLAKVEAGRMELQTLVFPIGLTLENSMVMIRERASRHGVTLETKIDPSLGPVEGDERKLKQILFNLLSNAVKFTPEGGRVTLAARPADDHVEISVIDTGIGISDEDQARIFDEFYQVGPGKTQEGTGLGLALTKSLVELHHGDLRVESQPGAGSTFTVTLPLRQPVAAAEEAHVLREEPLAL
jgi:signal transduction histidine kinase